MSSNFPLYNSLINDKCDDDLTTSQKDEFINITKNLDDAGHELIYALIRTYQIENCEDKTTIKLPYGGKYDKNDIKFNIDSFPNDLKNLLYNFLIIHKKKIEEDENRVSNEENDNTSKTSAKKDNVKKNSAVF